MVGLLDGRSHDSLYLRCRAVEVVLILEVDIVALAGRASAGVGSRSICCVLLLGTDEVEQVEEFEEDLEIWIVEVDLIAAFYMHADGLVSARDGFELFPIAFLVLVWMVDQRQLSIRRFDGLEVLSGPEQRERVAVSIRTSSASNTVSTHSTCSSPYASSRWGGRPILAARRARRAGEWPSSRETWLLMSDLV